MPFIANTEQQRAEMLAAIGMTAEQLFADFPPELTLDGKLDAASSWRADGNGQWIQYDLGAVRRLDEIRIAFVAGNSRIYTLDILVSKTGAEKEWTAAVEMAKSSGKMADYDPFKMNGAEARYVRIVGHGNNSEKFPNWINITELAIVEAVAAATQPATSTRPAEAATAPAASSSTTKPGTPNGAKFVHPGMYHNAADLAFMRKKIEAKAEPWLAAYKAFEGDAKANYTPHPLADWEV